MIASVEVSKTLSPDQDANAIGGEVNIRIADGVRPQQALLPRCAGVPSVATTSTARPPWEADGQIGGLFGANEQFGAVISANYSRRPITSGNFQGSDTWEDQNGVLLPDQQGLRDDNLTAHPPRRRRQFRLAAERHGEALPAHQLFALHRQ